MEPITLAVVGTAVLTESVKFLFLQAGEVLKRWRDNRDEPVPVPDHAPVEGKLNPARIHPDAMERLEDEIIDLRLALAPYNDDIAPAPVDADNRALVEVADALRQALEVVLGQRIRFKGEGGEQSAPLVEGELNVDEVLGYVAGVRARSIEGGVVRGVLKAKIVGPGGHAVGVEADRIGGS